MKNVYLLCNAHLDPAWLWKKSEGQAEAISTFRVAADFCEQFDGFVFNHNESVLYEWVEEAEPELFARIQRLVKEGKWNIIGGWYLQPDCNMPSGESILRQIQVGQQYFYEKFGVKTNTGFLVDSFGHSFGLVQLLKKSGYENYIHGRPPMKQTDYIWEGPDGSRIRNYCCNGYNSLKGQAVEKIKHYIEEKQTQNSCLVLWGIGNHGGGASREDLVRIRTFCKEAAEQGISISHSNALDYFAEQNTDELPVVNTSLRPVFVGCYTSMCRIKQKHREAENARALCEKMMAHAGLKTDRDELLKAGKAVLFNEFHDILPGTSIRAVEDQALAELDYANTVYRTNINRAFLKLCSGQPKAVEGEIPVMVYNPHPYAIETDVEVEYQLSDQNWTDGEFTVAQVRNKNGAILPSQHEKEASSLNLDWRKRLVFHTELAPMSMNRFDCSLHVEKDYQKIQPYTANEQEITVTMKNAEVRINKQNGLIASYTVNGREVLQPNSARLCVFSDYEDPWYMRGNDFSECIGVFELLSVEKAKEFGGCAPIEVIENGAVRTKVQALFGYKNSFAVVTYILSKFENTVDLHIDLFSNDRNVMIKYCIETILQNASFFGQTVFATEQLRTDGTEECFQKWCGLQTAENGLYVVNRGIYGGSSDGHSLCINLLRTPCYSGLPIMEREIVPKERCMEHMDMGLRTFTFKLVPQNTEIDLLAQTYNEEPTVLSFFPSGGGQLPPQMLRIENRNVLLSAFFATDMPNAYEFRLYNTTDRPQKTMVHFGDQGTVVTLGKYEVKQFTADSNGVAEKEGLA